MQDRKRCRKGDNKGERLINKKYAKGKELR